jgi:hypothetical protein
VFTRNSDMKRHKMCCHPVPITPRYWGLSLYCERSEHYPNAKPFFRKDKCERHKRSCLKIVQAGVKGPVGKNPRTNPVSRPDQHMYSCTSSSVCTLISGGETKPLWSNQDILQHDNFRVIQEKIHNSLLGVAHPSTLITMANKALTYRNQGQWKEAEELEVQVMETKAMVFGLDHPSTLTSMADLASTIWNQGHWKEAEELEA